MDLTVINGYLVFLLIMISPILLMMLYLAFTKLSLVGWSTVKTMSSSRIVDNRKSEYYKLHGFHEYDTMADIERTSCTYKIMKKKRGNEMKIVWDGDYKDSKLFAKANEWKDSIINKNT